MTAKHAIKELVDALVKRDAIWESDAQSVLRELDRE